MPSATRPIVVLSLLCMTPIGAQAQSQTLQTRLNLTRLRTLASLNSPRLRAEQSLVTQTGKTSTSAYVAQEALPQPRLVARSETSPRLAQAPEAAPVLLPIADNTEDQPRLVEPRRNRKKSVVTPSAAPGPALGTTTAGAPAANPAVNPATTNPAPDSTDSQTTAPQSIEGTPPEATTGRAPIAFYVDTRLGFDKQSVIVSNPTPFSVDEHRVISSLSLTASYPLGRRTDLSMNVPLIYQRTTARALGQTFKQTGKGLGDISVFLQQRFPEVSKGTEFAVAAGMAFPTGKDTFEVAANELPTGNGFYQALLNLSVRKMLVPLQLYASVNYGKSFSRNVAGQTYRLPDQYGMEAGFFYALGPEYTTQTAISWNKLSSPFILNPGSSVAYLTQALTYSSGKTTSVRGSVDVGLTDESTDAYLGLSFNREF